MKCLFTVVLPFILTSRDCITLGFSSSVTVPNHATNHRTDITRRFLAATQGTEGLSRYFQSILSRTNARQRFVTGKYPVIVTVEDNPTRKWLNLGRGENSATGTSHVMINGTEIGKSLASYDRFQWLDDDERETLHNLYASVSLELLAEIHVIKPAYLNVLSSDGAGSSTAAHRNVLPGLGWNRWKSNSFLHEEIDSDLFQEPKRGRLWTTGFSMASMRGSLKSIDIHDGHIESINKRSEFMTLWPNEVSPVPRTVYPSPQPNSAGFEDALLVSDGFLVPGKDKGAIYLIKNPGNPNSEWTVSLTDQTRSDRWFYHRAVWVDLTGDGRKSILTARAKLRKVKSSSGNTNTANRPTNGQLVWLEMPKPSKFDSATGTPLEEDGTTFDPFGSRHLPWVERVLVTGPDVMFSLADLDTEDDTIEVLASNFFDKKVTLHSVRQGPEPVVTFSRVIDDRCGSAFGGILADLDCGAGTKNRMVVDSGSTVATLRSGDAFSHLLVTSHECKFEDDERTTSMTKNDQKDRALPLSNSDSIDGGSVFAYRVPKGKDEWRSQPWKRTTIATGFKVNGQLWNVINPGAPGFVYTFYAKKDDASRNKRPMIAVAGDCAESAYIFRPKEGNNHERETSLMDMQAQYSLMCEIRCGATVGSIGIGYEDLCEAEQESGYAKIYIPCYEKDKILVFAMGSGEDNDEYDFF